jgi:hypothetical protein
MHHCMFPIPEYIQCSLKVYVQFKIMRTMDTCPKKTGGIMSLDDKEWIKLKKYALKKFVEFDVYPESCQ